MKLLTDTDYIHALIAEGEHQQQDFKFEISDARKIAKTLSAFANTDGGRLLIGVKDNGKIAGVRSEEEKYMIEAAAQLYCIPEVEYTMQTYIVEGRQVLVVTIEETPHKPVYAKDENGKPLAYLRIKDENILATPIHLRVWQQSDSPRGELIRYTEREQLLLDQLEQGNLLSLNRYCRRTGLSRRAAEHLLAKFVRYDIVEPVFENHKFYFRIATKNTGYLDGSANSVQLAQQKRDNAGHRKGLGMLVKPNCFCTFAHKLPCGSQGTHFPLIQIVICK